MSETVEKAATPGVTRWAWGAYALAAVLLVLDQLSKAWMLANLPEGGTMEVIWPLQFTRIWNQGVSFGLMQAEHDVVRWGMVLFNVVVGALLAFWARSQNRFLPAMGLGFLIAGALGNAVDRTRLGAVVDFLDVSRLGFFPWIFNGADVCITLGVIAILLDSLRRERPA